MKFLLKYPTRQRPEWCLKTTKLWLDMLSGKHQHQFLFSIDADDTQSIAIIPQLEKLGKVCIGNSPNKIAACNADMGKADPWDIVILVSDDMEPIIKGYDDIIASKMSTALDEGLWFYDGNNDHTWTLTIMGVNLYKKLGYMYYPEYKSLVCDDDLQATVAKLGKLRRFDECIIKHNHFEPGNPNTDDLYMRNSVFNQWDYYIFDKRKKLSFPI
jgi:hypothetical protein